MSSLESHVNDRMGKAIRSRLAWERRCQRFPSPLKDFIGHKLWKWPYRHMRAFPLPVGFEPARSGGWDISRDSNPVTTTVPLLDWIGTIDRPVTIVAGGPSALQHPVEDLRDGGRMIVAVNGVPAYLAERGIQPDVWIASDPHVAPHLEANFANAAGTPLALTARVAAALAMKKPAELAKRPLCIIERVNQWHGVSSVTDQELMTMNESSGSPFHFPETGARKSVVGWSRKPELGFFSGKTVVFAALQLLIRLGARDIEIVGMDLTATGHAYADVKGTPPITLTDDYESSILPSFELMHGALEGTGVVVKNLSPVCPLPRRVFGL